MSLWQVDGFWMRDNIHWPVLKFTPAPGGDP